tara:strand:- start:10242 stop:10379 length:138 start_codon:yes stop_codon:yes gene_type:complete
MMKKAFGPFFVGIILRAKVRFDTATEALGFDPKLQPTGRHPLKDD